MNPDFGPRPSARGFESLDLDPELLRIEPNGRRQGRGRRESFIAASARRV
jgi:hypothetical protein